MPMPHPLEADFTKRPGRTAGRSSWAALSWLMAPGHRASNRESASVSTIHLAGGRLCLDFANTGVWDEQRQQTEYLSDYSDVLVWGERQGLLSAARANALRSACRDDPQGSADALGRLIELRSGVRLLLKSDPRVRPAPLRLLNWSLAEGAGSVTVEGKPGGFEFGGKPDLFWSIAGPVSLSIAELLTSPDLARVRACDAEPCGWFFLDTSKSGTRRWCTMEICGNRSKARSHYARRQQSQPNKGA